MVALDGRKPFFQPRLSSVDFLAATDQAHHNTPIFMPIHYRQQELRFGHVEVSLSSLFAHKSGGLFSIPGPLGLIEHDNSFSGYCRCANIFITKVVNVLDKCACVTIGIPLAHSLSAAGFAAV